MFCFVFHKKNLIDLTNSWKFVIQNSWNHVVSISIMNISPQKILIWKGFYLPRSIFFVGDDYWLGCSPRDMIPRIFWITNFDELWIQLDDNFLFLEILGSKKNSPVIETWQIEIKTFLIRKIILGHEVLRAESNKLSCHVIGPVWLG